ncbi:MAG: Y-family DNA polymerase [Kiritimatiellae bacterium]|nr:Y-family DNA polymerase [Kiritimatiellia bacterium]
MIGLVDGNNFFVSCERVVDPRLNGKPVAVLSNNDGCCVSRSNEFKALGIPMGTPYFQLKDRMERDGLIFRSSNYELYGDLSRRIVSILRKESVAVEQYSIDEAFIFPPSTAKKDLNGYGKRLRAKILQWVGIPCGIGFATTKTLAKIANHIGKKRPDGVFVMPDDPTPILSKLPVEEIWGIGRRLSVTLHQHGIHTAEQFRNESDEVIRHLGSVVTLRTAMELRGIPCVEADHDEDPKSISCSRSFGEPVTTLEGLSESIASFTAQAAEKLRRHGLLAAGVNIYAQYGKACEQTWADKTVIFPHPTDATNEMLQAIQQEIGALFVDGLRYRKSGMVFLGLEKAGTARQQDLFSQTPSQENSKLYQVVDTLNARYGKGKVFSASEGIGENRSWKMKREMLSRRATTNWGELIVVH